jgi:serine/threonine protein kinase
MRESGESTMDQGSSICAQCGENAGVGDLCKACGSTPLLDARYRLDSVIGRGGAGITYVATRVADGERFCVKELAFHRLASLEAERLFRREARVLRQLEHPQIPSYEDELVAGAGRSMALYLVQTFVDGEDLESEMSHHRYDEREVLDIGAELLGILEYLQGLSPHVAHRDIKPSNVMRRRVDGRLVLVDFGSVKRLDRDTLGAGDTITGTYGYMAPEQFQGKTTLQSDLYSVGALMLALYTGRDPIELVDEEHQLRWKPAVRGSSLSKVLSALLARRPDDRPASAVAARRLVAKALIPTVRQAAAGPPIRPNVTHWMRRDVASASNRRNNKLGLLVGGGIALVLTVAVLAASGSRTETSITKSPCGTAPCAGLDAPFDTRLRFGMSEDEVAESRPEASAGSFRMLVADRPASCTLAFAAGSGLSEIECEMDGPPPYARTWPSVQAVFARMEEYGKVVRRLFHALGARYGPSNITTEFFMVESNERYEWISEDGKIVLRNDRDKCMLVLTQTHGEHESRRDAAERFADEKREAESAARQATRAAARSAAEEKRREGIEKLRERTGDGAL